MKRGIVIVFASLAVLIMVTLHYSVAQVPADAKKPAAETAKPPTPAEKGKGLYMKYCALCHGDSGEGYLADEANALANQDFLKSATDGFIVEAIIRGRPGTPMSAWGEVHGGVLTYGDVQALVAFMRGWQKEEAVNLSWAPGEVNAKDGGKIYKERCAACHGQQGEGASALSLSNPVFQATASDGFIAYAITNGRRGTSMPAFKSSLSSKKTANIIAYLRTLESPEKEAPKRPDIGDAFDEEGLKKGLLNPGNPLARFLPVQGRYVPADSVYKAYTAKKSFIILDARPYNDYLKAHILGAVSVPFYEVENALDYLPKDVWIIAYCVCPHAMSGKAVDALRKAGFDKTAILDEGFQEWMRRGYPVAAE
jgi:cytochrome c oxidase cbb3-type subunit 3